MTLKIDGMMCKNCVAHVKKALEAVSGLTAEVQLEGGKAVIDAPASMADALKKAVTDAGYEVVSVEA